MPFITISKPAVGDPTKKTFADEVVDDLVYLNSQLSAKEGSVINPSMESDVDNDGDPDGWVFTDYPNGSHAIDTTNNAHGANGIKFISTVLADGGGYGDSEDYYAVAEGEVYAWKAWRIASVANISCQYTVTWYTGAKASISTSTLFQDTDAPTTNTLATGTVTAPANARFAKLRVEGGIPATGTATGDITFDGLGFDTIYPDTVTQGMIAAAAVGQAELKSTTGAVSTSSTSKVDLTMPGGSYGFYPQTKESGGGLGARIGGSGAAAGSNIGNTYITNIALHAVTSGTAYAQQRYIQASPPYDLGNGAIPLFIYALIDNATGAVVATYCAEDPPWANNGPTNIRPDRIDTVTGRKYQRVKKLIAEYGNYENAKDALITSELYDRIINDPYVDREVTQKIKQADMSIIPHPFDMEGGLSGLTVVMLDPLGMLTGKLLPVVHDGGASEIAEVIHAGGLKIGNKDNGAKAPPGVMPVDVSFKLTR